MCGITGIVGKGVNRYNNIIKIMNDKLLHRGPDGDGFLIKENCLLGHRRLSIIDLELGHQPMHNEGCSIVFNGEFYGYREIKKNLDYNWQTNSDTEVLLALYKKYGVDNFVKHIKGMFAFGLWDDETQTFIAGRDRFGEKPFYYAITNKNELVFSSELKSIIASNLIYTDIDDNSLNHYLKHLYVHPTKTIYKQINVLPSGSYLVFKNGCLKIEQYWYPPEKPNYISYDEAKQEVKRLIIEAVSEQMIADVPVASFLSGGIDSSIITAVASKYSNSPLTSISFGFNENDSEFKYSRILSRQYGIKNIELQASEFDIASYFIKVNDVFDEPFADSSSIPTFIISELASKHFKCVLTGDGGDEMFGGYQQWYNILYKIFYAKNFVEKAGIAIKKILHSKYRSSNIHNVHYKQNIYFNDKQVMKLNKSKTYSVQKKLINFENSLESILIEDALDYMPGDILVKTDRTSMFNSLELRSPFLNVPLADFCLSLPIEYKVNKKETKLILRDVFKDMLPKEIIDRPKKGFGAPVHQWLQNNKMQQLKRDILENKSSEIYEHIDFEYAKLFFAKNDYKTWILLNLALWMKRK